mmetsp:Transcript_26198/g.63855  ORF Transcript_26198/g.63855 Transcript_26198/m.63855 type:complete len:449 (-) Transcript_26198:116-1462(-)
MLATMSQATITTSKRRRLPSFEHLNGQEDFHRMYTASERKHGWGSTRSVSSFNTDDGAGSTSTEPMSNTVRAREKKQKEKRRFLSFTKVLMKFLEKKNPTVCKNAKKVILKYKSKKKQQRQHYYGEDDVSESMCESIKVPLKQTVGSAYWKQAKGYLDQMEAKEDQANDKSRNEDGGGTDFEPLSLDSNTGYFSETQVEALSHFADNGVGDGITDNSKRSCRSNENQLVVEEQKLRKQRFWMVVRVLMQYIEKKDTELAKKARATLEDCAKRNVMKEDRFTNLIESVQRELKQTVGARYWRRAEHYVAKHLLKKANEKALEDALVKEASTFGSLDDFTPLPLDEQHGQPTNPLILETTFAPPRHSRENWRDLSIPANVAIPTKRPAEDWTLECDSHLGDYEESCTTDASYQDGSLAATEMNRKRRKLWRRPYSHFLNRGERTASFKLS